MFRRPGGKLPGRQGQWQCLFFIASKGKSDLLRTRTGVHQQDCIADLLKSSDKDRDFRLPDFIRSEGLNGHPFNLHFAQTMQFHRT